MFKPTEAKDVKSYLASLPEKRLADILLVDKLIRKTSPKLKQHFAYNMIGYGSFKYLNYQKKIIDWPIISLASQKNYISLYVCSIADKQYLAEKYKDPLGKVSVGKSCIRFKKIQDVNLKKLAKVIKLAEKHPGLVKN